MSNEKRIAIIKFDKELDKDQRKLTHMNTYYLYVDVTLEYLEEYKQNYSDKEYLKLTNIEISKTNLDLVKKGQIFKIDIINAVDNGSFKEFATIYEAIYVPYYQDKFLLKNREKLNLLNHPNTWIDYHNEKHDNNKVIKIDFEDKNFLFLSKFNGAHNFIEELSSKIRQKLYYDIYDVDGYLSILTNDKDFEFYFDLGDLSNSFKPKKLNPFGILITHYHFDHYNMLLNHNFNASNYILPYSGSILYNGKQLYPADEIRLLSKIRNNIYLLIKGQPYKKGSRNKLIPLIMSDTLTLYFPLRPSPRNRNIESICINFNNKVFYPGDSMFYMYKEYIKNIPDLVAAHHGGSTGTINLNCSVISNIIINTHKKNYNSTVYTANLSEYRKDGRTVNVINTYNGLKAYRINV